MRHAVFGALKRGQAGDGQPCRAASDEAHDRSFVVARFILSTCTLSWRPQVSQTAQRARPLSRNLPARRSARSTAVSRKQRCVPARIQRPNQAQEPAPQRAARRRHRRLAVSDRGFGIHCPIAFPTGVCSTVRCGIGTAVRCHPAFALQMAVQRAAFGGPMRRSACRRVSARAITVHTGWPQGAWKGVVNVHL